MLEKILKVLDTASIAAKVIVIINEVVIAGLGILLLLAKEYLLGGLLILVSVLEIFFMAWLIKSHKHNENPRL